MKLSCLFRRAEAEEQHCGSENNVQVGISRIVRDQSEQHAFAFHEPENGDQGVHKSEDFEECARGAGSSHSAKQKDDARRDVDNAMRAVDHENAKQHWHTVGIRCGGCRHKAEDSDREKNNTEKNCSRFNHSDLLVRLRNYAYGRLTEWWQVKTLKLFTTPQVSCGLRKQYEQAFPCWRDFWRTLCRSLRRAEWSAGGNENSHLCWRLFLVHPTGFR